MDFSIVVPVYNEAESLPELHRELQSCFTAIGGQYEFIFVDDGSTDGSEKALREIAQSDENVKVIRLVRNYGKSAAYAAGFEALSGDVVITLDADLQDDPNEIPKLLHIFQKRRYDLVIGWKQGRTGNEPMKSIPSKFYNALKGRLFGLHLHDTNCGFRVMQREVADALQLYGDQYRFIPELAHLRGFRVGEAKVHHRARRYGVSKFGAMRFYTGILDLVSVRFLTSYAPKPLHFFGRISLPPFLFGMLLEFYVLLQKMMGSPFQTHVAAIIIGVMFIMIGIQFLSIGLVCEMISAQGRDRRYYIRERFGFSSDE